MTYRHIVLFRVHEGVSGARVDEAVGLLRSLNDLPMVESLRIERSLDARKGTMIVEEAEFVDAAAFRAFRAHRRHVEVATAMAEISDWWVGDYLA